MNIQLIAHEHEGGDRNLEMTLPELTVFLQPSQARMLSRRFAQWANEGEFCEDCSINPCEEHERDINSKLMEMNKSLRDELYKLRGGV